MPGWFIGDFKSELNILSDGGLVLQLLKLLARCVAFMANNISPRGLDKNYIFSETLWSMAS